MKQKAVDKKSKFQEIYEVLLPLLAHYLGIKETILLTKVAKKYCDELNPELNAWVQMEPPNALIAFPGKERLDSTQVNRFLLVNTIFRETASHIARTPVANRDHPLAFLFSRKNDEFLNVAIMGYLLCLFSSFFGMCAVLYTKSLSVLHGVGGLCGVGILFVILYFDRIKFIYNQQDQLLLQRDKVLTKAYDFNLLTPDAKEAMDSGSDPELVEGTTLLIFNR